MLTATVGAGPVLHNAGGWVSYGIDRTALKIPLLSVFLSPTNFGRQTVAVNIDPYDWVHDAACRDLPTSWWFPGLGESFDLAVSICQACPVQVVDVLEADAALDLVGRITAQNRRVNVEAGALVELVAEALKGRAWIPLGYGSWDELVTEMGWEFRPATTEDRAELVRSMRESGMSLRAIGRTVGTSKSQVERDLASTVPNGTVGPVTGVNGKTYQPTRPPAEAVDDLEMGPHADRLFPGEPDAIVEELETAGIPLTGENLDHAAEEAIESRETPLPAPNPITKPDLDGTGLSHPARYTESILPTCGHPRQLHVTGPPAEVQRAQVYLSDHVRTLTLYNRSGPDERETRRARDPALWRCQVMPDTTFTVAQPRPRHLRLVTSADQGSGDPIPPPSALEIQEARALALHAAVRRGTRIIIDGLLDAFGITAQIWAVKW